jgi:hypothetical protein
MFCQRKALLLLVYKVKNRFAPGGARVAAGWLNRINCEYNHGVIFRFIKHGKRQFVHFFLTPICWTAAASFPLDVARRAGTFACPRIGLYEGGGW